MSGNEEENIMLKVAEERARNYNSIPNSSSNYNDNKPFNEHLNYSPKKGKETSDSVCCFALCSIIIFGIICSFIVVYR